MEDINLKRDIRKATNEKKRSFWGSLIAVVSILQGEFIVRVDGYLLEHSEPYLKNLPESAIGWLLILFGLIKLIAVIVKNNRFKKYAIWGLSALWTGLFLIALTYSFGTGFPHPSWITYMMVMISCYRVSLKGDFEH